MDPKTQDCEVCMTQRFNRFNWCLVKNHSSVWYQDLVGVSLIAQEVQYANYYKAR